MHSRISASKLNRLNRRELRACGAGGSCVAAGIDVQAQAIFAGKRPVDDLEGWSYGGFIVIEQEREPLNSGSILSDLAASRNFLRDTGF